MTKEEMFNENIKLAYKVANKYRINCMQEFEDIKQIALLGLWKAVIKYNGKHTLSTFAYIVIQNEINQYLRNNRRKTQEISITTKVYENTTLEDVLQAKDDIEELLDSIELTKIKQALDEVLEDEKEDYRQVYELQMQRI